MGDKQRRLKDKASRAYAAGSHKEALKLFKRVVEEDPTELQCQLKIGDIHRKAGRPMEAVTAYKPVAIAYAEDGLLLKSIAVAKMILSIDSDHQETQNMLADLYAKRRGPTKSPLAEAPAVTLTGLGVRPAEEKSNNGLLMEYGLIDPEPEVAAPSPSSPPKLAANVLWPAAQPAPEVLEDSVLHIELGDDVLEDSAPQVVMGERLEDSVLDIEVGEVLTPAPPARKAPVDNEASIELELEDLGDHEPLGEAELPRHPDAPAAKPPVAPVEAELLDAPADKPARQPAARLASERFGGGSIEDSWTGEVRIEDLDDPTRPSTDADKQALAADAVAEVESAMAALDPDADEPLDVEIDAPIELTDVIDSRDLGSTLVLDDGFDDGVVEAEALGDLGRPNIPLFSDLPKNAFIELLVQMEMTRIRPGQQIIQEGDVGDSFFVVASGRVRVERQSVNGPVVLAHLGDGAFFGEMALLQDGARTASVVAESEGQIFEISKEVLDHVVGRFPSVANALRNFYKQRLLSTAMATHALFSPFEPDERRRLMEMFKSKSFSQGDVLLEQGKKGGGLFLVLYGALEVVIDDPPQVVAELTSGDLFGEMSLLMNQPAMATVRATQDCFILRLSRKKFDELIMTHPQVLELVSALTEERRKANDRDVDHTGRYNAVLV